MLITIMLILFIISILIAILAKSENFGFAAFWVAVVIIVPSAFSIMDNAKDLGTMRSYSLVIEFHKETIKELKQDIETIAESTPTTALLNADMPLSSMVKALAGARTNMNNSRLILAKAHVSMEKRKAGPFWYIAKIYGDK